MAASISQTLWSMTDLAKMVEAAVPQRLRARPTRPDSLSSSAPHFALMRECHRGGDSRCAPSAMPRIKTVVSSCNNSTSQLPESDPGHSMTEVTPRIAAEHPGDSASDLPTSDIVTETKRVKLRSRSVYFLTIVGPSCSGRPVRHGPYLPSGSR